MGGECTFFEAKAKSDGDTAIIGTG